MKEIGLVMSKVFAMICRIGVSLDIKAALGWNLKVCSCWERDPFLRTVHFHHQHSTNYRHSFSQIGSEMIRLSLGYDTNAKFASVRFGGQGLHTGVKVGVVLNRHGEEKMIHNVIQQQLVCREAQTLRVDFSHKLCS